MYAGSSRDIPAKGPPALRQRSFADFRLFLAVPLPEQQRDAPQARQAHQGIDDPAHGRQLAAEQPRHAVEGEKAHASPVQRAHDHQDQRNAVYDLQRDSLPFSRNICLIMPALGRDIQKIFARLKIFLISAVSDCNPGREYV